MKKHTSKIVLDLFEETPCRGDFIHFFFNLLHQVIELH